MAAVELNERGAAVRDTRVDGFGFDPSESVRVDVALMLPSGGDVAWLLKVWATNPQAAVSLLAGQGEAFLISVEQ